MHIILCKINIFNSESTMFDDTDLHLCVLTPDPMTEGTNQHTVYHNVSCCKLQLSKLIKVFCISQSYFISRENNLCVISDFICRKWFRKWSVWISRVYCSVVHRNQHEFLMMSPTRHATFNTIAGGQHFVNFERCFW